jgi:hypothetical protein
MLLEFLLKPGNREREREIDIKQVVIKGGGRLKVGFLRKGQKRKQ